MKKHESWLAIRTTRAYIHRPLSERIITVYPDFKVTALELNDTSRHFDQRGAGMHFLFNGEDCDFHAVEWEKPSGGLPVYTLYGRDEKSGCRLTLTAFCGGGRLPATYCELIISNDGDTPISANAGLLPRVSDSDHYLTGEFDTGYEPYSPNVRQWLLCRDYPFECKGKSAVSKGGYMRAELLSLENCSFKWVSRDEQKNRFEPNDYFDFDCEIPPKSNAKIRAAMLLDSNSDYAGYDDALSDTRAYWEELQDRVALLPDTGDENIIALFRHCITQSMQMMQYYANKKDPDFVYARQGDVGRHIWVWEAVHYLTLLDRVGIFDNVSDCYRMFIENWQLHGGERDGMLDNPFVSWENTNGIFLAGLSYHLMKMDDPSLFASFKPAMDSAYRYIKARRSAARGEKEIAGLFSSGKASDWGEVGQHWTYTDAVNARGLELTARCYERFNADNASEIRAEYTAYSAVINAITAKLAVEHYGEKAFIIPHILGRDFESTWQHCFYTDGIPYLIPLGFLDPNSELFSHIEAFYREIGMLDDEHGLAGRMTNDYGSPGLYGNVYYTGVAEYNWIEGWLARGEREKAAKYLAGLLKYNVSPEFISAERYCSTDPFYAPWQPNGSGSGRLGHLLLDFYRSWDAGNGGNEGDEGNGGDAAF